MSRATPDDQLKFLLSCARYSNNGRIDFVEVARECGVVSKGAAAKRYERLLKANGIHPHGGPVERLSIPKMLRQKSKTEIDRAAAAKRRKIEGDDFDFKIYDEEETKPVFRNDPIDLPHIKPEPGRFISPFQFGYTTATHPQPFHPVSLPPRMHSPISNPQLVQRWMPQRVPDVYVHDGYRGMNRSPVILNPIMRQTPQPVDQEMIALTQSQDTATTLEESSTAVPEEQIQSMYDEFCSQDLFKVSKFDWSSPVPNTEASTALPSVSPNFEPDSSPKTADGFEATLIDPQLRPMDNQEPKGIPEATSVGNVIDTKPATTPAEATGKDIKDSILILD